MSGGAQGIVVWGGYAGTHRHSGHHKGRSRGGQGHPRRHAAPLDVCHAEAALAQCAGDDKGKDGAAGQTERQRYFAGQAVESFKKSEQTMGGNRLVAKGFAQMLRQCQEFLEEKS